MVTLTEEQKQNWRNFQRYRKKQQHAGYCYNYRPDISRLIIRAIHQFCYGNNGIIHTFKVKNLHSILDMDSRVIGHYMPYLVQRGVCSVFSHTRNDSDRYKVEFLRDELSDVLGKVGN